MANVSLLQQIPNDWNDSCPMGSPDTLRDESIQLLRKAGMVALYPPGDTPPVLVRVFPEGGLDGDLLRRMFRTNCAFLQDVQSEAFTSNRRVEAGHSYLLHSAPLTERTTEQWKTQQRASAGLSDDLLKRLRLYLLRRGHRVPPHNEIAAFCRQMKTLPSGAALSSYEPHIRTLETVGIFTWENVRTAVPWVWEVHGIPSELRTFLTDTAAKMVGDLGTRQLTPMKEINKYDAKSNSWESFKCDDYDTAWHMDKKTNQVVINYYLHFSGGVKCDKNKLKNGIVASMNEWAHVLKCDNPKDKKNPYQFVFNDVTDKVNQHFKEDVKKTNSEALKKYQSEIVAAKKEIREKNKETEDIRKQFGELKVEMKKLRNDKIFKEKYPFETLMLEYETSNPLFSPCTWEDWIDAVFDESDENLKKIVDDSGVKETPFEVNDSNVWKLLEGKPFNEKKVTASQRDDLLDALESYLEDRCPEILKAKKKLIKKKTFNEVFEIRAVWTKAMKDLSDLQEKLSDLEVKENDAKNGAIASTRNYLNEGMDMDNMLVIWVGDLAAIGREYKETTSENNQNARGLKKGDPTQEWKKKYPQDLKKVGKWNQFILKKLITDSKFNDVVDDCNWLQEMQKDTGVNFVSEKKNHQSPNNEIVDKAIAFLCQERKSSTQAPAILNFVKNLVKEDKRKTYNDLGFKDVQEMKDTLKKIGDKEWKRICGIDTAELKKTKEENKQKRKAEVLGMRGASADTVGYVKNLGANYKDPDIVYLLNPEFLATAKRVPNHKYFKNNAYNMSKKSKDYIRCHNLLVLADDDKDMLTIAHELGHVLGLDEEFLSPSADEMWNVADLVESYKEDWENDPSKVYRACEDHTFDLGSLMVYESTVVRLSKKAKEVLNEKIKVEIPKPNGEAEIQETKLSDAISTSWLPSVWDAAFLRHVYFQKRLTKEEIAKIPQKASEGALLSAYDQKRRGYRNGEELRKNIRMLSIKKDEQIITEYLCAVKKSVLDDVQMLQQNIADFNDLLDKLEAIDGRMKSNSKFANENDSQEAEKIAVKTRPLVKNFAAFMLRVSILALNSQLILESRKDMPAFNDYIPLK